MTAILGAIPSRVWDTAEVYLLPKNQKELICAVTALALSLIHFKAALLIGACYLGYKALWAEKLPNPHDVLKIYTPVQYEERDWGPYAEKVSQLKTTPGVIGVTFVPSRDESKKLPVYITRSQAEDKFTEVFRVFDLKADKQIGFAEINPYTKENGYLEAFWIAGVPEHIENDRYGKHVDKVILNQVTNEKGSQYKQVGVVLIKAILETFMNLCSGRMILDAVRTTQPYYYQLGFRMSKPRDVEMDATCARVIRWNQRFTKDMGSHWMDLPDNGRVLWQREIKQQSVLFQS